VQAGTLQDVWFWLVPLCIAGYLMGSISSAILVCRLFGYPDPRTEGSNNPGATNVLRIGGKPAAALTLLGDVLKGVIPVILARSLDMGPFVAALVGTSAFLGHLYPVFFHFQGGKGVATAFGLLFAHFFHRLTQRFCSSTGVYLCLAAPGFLAHAGSVSGDDRPAPQQSAENPARGRTGVPKERLSPQP